MSRSLLTIIFVVVCVFWLSFAQDESVLKEKWCGDANCYTLLGVSPDSNHREIKTRYNNVSLELHPDKNPNQTEEDKELYRNINLAYEILGDPKKRRDYDRYLEIKASLDSPRENIIFVLLILGCLSVFFVKLYKNQNYQNLRKSILSRSEVRRFLRNKYNIDLSANSSKQSKSKKDRKSRKRSKNISDSQSFSEGYSIASQLLSNTDPTRNNPMDNVSDDQINEIIKHFNFDVPGWDIESPKPSWNDAVMEVPNFFKNSSSQLIFTLRWNLLYNILSREYSDSDREYLCRTKFKISQNQWNNFNDKEKQKYMNKNGVWNSKKKKTN